MALHILKLCVGIDDVDMLRTRQAMRLRQEGGVQFVPGFTRRRPRRADEIIGHGSIYWIIKGRILVRQRMLDMVEATDPDGTHYCQFRFEPDLIEVESRAHRAFQGWRYLEDKDAPADRPAGFEADDDMPPEMAEELRFLGLL